MRAWRIPILISVIALLLLIFVFNFRSTSFRPPTSNCPPSFKYEIAFEEATPDGQVKEAILVLPPSEYSAANLHAMLSCYSKDNPAARTMIVRVFTDKTLATPGNMFLIMGNWRHIVKAYPYDASFIRDYSDNGASATHLDESYEYRPLPWLPLWTRRVFMKKNETLPPIVSAQTRETNQKRCSSTEIPKQPPSAFDYRITCIWPAGEKTGTRLIYGFIHARELNETDLKSLGRQLNRHLSSFSSVHVSLWDNEEKAKYFGSARLDDFSGFEKNLRVTYVSNREEHRSFIEYYPEKNATRSKVRIDLSTKTK